MKNQYIISKEMFTQNVKLIIIALITFMQLSNAQSLITPDDSFDVFPLKPGLLYSYKFYSSNNSGDEMVRDILINTGIVSYKISDSTFVNDSTIEWKIYQIRNILREVINYNPMYNSDSTYLINDTIQCVLLEKMSGKHELTCSVTAWNLPQPSFRGGIKEPVYRYSIDKEKKYASQWSAQNINYTLRSGFDTLCLSSEFGLYRRIFDEQWSSGYLSGYYKERIVAIHGPISEVESIKPHPDQIQLIQNYPNPFNPTTTISYSILKAGYVTIKVYDILGREIAELVNEKKSVGIYQVIWDASGMPSGTYFYRLNSGLFTDTKKLILLK